ncbi:STAS/SEC14 domain-containing protein [Xanthovirga aplysinae]|uniref:STAS/SEC14 domain-containing protein n=1 Tax=Xanthovirga aplysinae TaxID=2529853 RepID=UPI0016576272|nr:STAS/SEC14 domain-containing protein [Xanthovirga aplysinae]
MIRKLENSDEKNLGFKISGMMTDFDYKNKLVPETEEALKKNQTINLLFKIEDFEGENIPAMWSDLKYGIKTYGTVERWAIVGNKRWLRVMTKLSKPFLKGEIKYFEDKDTDNAWEWLKAA